MDKEIKKQIRDRLQKETSVYYESISKLERELHDMHNKIKDYVCNEGVIHEVINEIAEGIEDYIITKQIDERDKRDTGMRYSLDEALKLLK